MSNVETKLGQFRKAWTATRPMRSHWPAHLEPLPEAERPESEQESGQEPRREPAPRLAGFFLNADDTPRFGGPTLAWPEPVAVIAPRPFPTFLQLANEERTRAA